jgi:hypothetical protein
MNGWITGDPKQTNAFLSHFQMEQANSLAEIVRILVEECKKGKDLHQLVYPGVNVTAS